jgi:hypothetical protein
LRIAALIFGIAAAIFAVVAPELTGTNLRAPFAALFGEGQSRELLGLAAWYGIPAAAALGGFLASFIPGLAALLLLGAAAGWLAAGVMLPTLIDYHLLAPAGLACVAAVLAVFAAESDRRMAVIERRQRRQGDDAAPPLRALPALSDREVALRVDPQLGTRDGFVGRPNRDIPMSLEDIVLETPTQRPQQQPPQQRWDRPEPQNYRRPTPFRALPAPSRSDYRVTAAGEPVAAYGRPKPEPYRMRPPQRGGGWLATANGLAVIVLGAVIAYLLYQNGQIPGLAPPSATVVATAPAAPAAASAPVVVANREPTRLVDDADPATQNPIPALRPAAQQEPAPQAVDAQTTAAVTPAPAPNRPAAAQGGSYDDPFAYCSAVGTIDFVDSRYTGPAFTAAIASALRIPAASSQDRVHWRCFNGAVLACQSFDWPICAMTPVVVEMLEFCKANPTVPRLLAPNGTWSCEGGKPKIPNGASWPVDERGFMPAAWIQVPPSG